MNDWDSLIERHRALDSIVEKADRTKFLSDWNCTHPYYKKKIVRKHTRPDKIQQYNYIRSEDNLTQLISDFHQQSEKTFYDLEEIVTSNGSTTIIGALFIWLSLNNIREVYYIPPVYYTFSYFSRLYGISFRPITKSHLFEKKYSLNLPEKKAILLITDPIWYAGVSVPVSVYKSLKKWQRATGSTIIVDGSFQYFNWTGSKYESSSQLEKLQTLRLVCPTKAIATHGFRFSYLLVPHEKYDLFDHILDNISGSSAAQDILCAEKCMNILLSSKSNSELIIYAKKHFEELLNKKVIDEVVKPDCGYFVFARLNSIYTDMFRVMDGQYFQQKEYPGYVRINLLSSSVQKLLKSL
jgi:histidinol-phosphate/aromatic aminotransferase/cobyric acid decarboxylase-like protein